MGYLDQTNIQNHIGGTFSVIITDGNVHFTTNDGWTYHDGNYVNEMTKGYSDFSGSTALVAGLGLGVIPQWLAVEKNCQVDVIEINPEVISVMEGYGHLSNNITIIEDDILDYVPTKNYDLIVCDIWWVDEPQAFTEKSIIETSFQSYTNNLQFPFI